MSNCVLLGAVAYDPKVVTIWEGFRHWFRDHDLDLDFVLYSNYERQVTDLVDGRIDCAWNSPLAFVRSRRLAPDARALAMRDTDRDLTSVIVVRRDDPARSLTDLAGRSVATGAIDSPQATLLPVALLISALGAEVAEAAVKGFDVGAGLHGDHIGGERDAARALAAGKVDAACMTDANHLLFTTEGTLAPNATRVVGVTATYDHCNMTVNGRGSPATERFAELLFGMDYADPVVRPLLDLEGLSAWLPGRDEGYAPLEEAVDLVGFYGPKGELTANGYRP